MQGPGLLQIACVHSMSATPFKSASLESWHRCVPITLNNAQLQISQHPNTCIYCWLPYGRQFPCATQVSRLMMPMLESQPSSMTFPLLPDFSFAVLMASFTCSSGNFAPAHAKSPCSIFGKTGLSGTKVA